MKAPWSRRLGRRQLILAVGALWLVAINAAYYWLLLGRYLGDLVGGLGLLGGR